MILLTIAIIVHRYLIVKRGSMTVELLHNHRVQLRRDDFQVNADYLLHHLTREQLRDLVMVMGIDYTGIMELNTPRGVAYYLLKYLNENYTVNGEMPSEVVQKRINHYCDTHPTKDPIFRLKPCACVETRMMLTSKQHPEEEPLPCNLLMVANSQKEDYSDDMRIEAIKHNGEANLVIPSIFNYLKDTKTYTSMLIGIIGSNGLKLPYLSIFSQIINQFAWLGFIDKDVLLQDVYISIREQDYQGIWEVSLSQLESYLRECSKYYPTRVVKQ